MLFKGINEQEFKEKIEISFSNIMEGFDNYINGSLQGAVEVLKEEIEDKIIAFIGELIELNGEGNSIVDFYFTRLSEEEKECLKEFLSKEDKEVLQGISKELVKDSIYFNLTKENMPFLVRLSTREVLFSTFYFTKVPCTIWGNYDLKFPCFFKEVDDLERYREISEKLGLYII